MGLFDRFKKSLEKTRKQLSGAFEEIFLEEKGVDEETLQRLEEFLITSDMGAKAVEELMSSLKPRFDRKELKELNQIKAALKEELKKILSGIKKKNPKYEFHQTPHVMMIIGVNGVGKTTSIGKLAHRMVKEGRSTLLAAGDTFRAAATEQLVIWGKRNGVEVISQQHGADPSAVAFDAYAAAKARKIELLIIDTAGRLHTKTNLMDELKKVKRTLGKIDPLSPHEVILVLDATQGQNALSQARMFHEAVGVTGIILAKLDSSSRGGIVISIWNELKIPIYWVGMGEKESDLEPFDADAFVDALFAD
ncbi:MAG: signal recognition particle-docking protein FtsY [Nitrospirae bacterium]|nr:signal recognition particle-docking protein FtsY [Nitrospirota bacterium]MBI3594186.1 signal recognition particle-docking protein FtsY [Nitrospirota bacterium]